MGFRYIDGLVQAYHGRHTIPKAYLARTRLAVPGTTGYRVNDKKGEPLFVVTAEASAAMTRVLAPYSKTSATRSLPAGASRSSSTVED